MKKDNRTTVASLIKNLKSRLSELRKPEAAANLKRNWYFPVSAMAFFCLTMDNTVGYCLGMLIVCGIMIIIASRISSVRNFILQHSVSARILSAAVASGICLGNQRYFYEETLKLIAELSLPAIFNKLFLILSYFGAVCAVFFVFCCILVFVKEMKRIFSETHILDGIKTAEWIIYGLLLAASLGFMVFSFAKTQAFYGTEHSFDIIYTSDSPALVKKNVYMALTHWENDLRQPLFAVFAAPFTGIPYLISRLIGASAGVQAMLVNSVQVIMLFAANFMLARMMKLDPLKRTCFMTLTSLTYTQLLFTLMMEQYIVAYFWLIFCLYLICEKQQPDRIALWGTGGTLLTGMILLPFMSNKSPIKNFKVWFMDMVKYGLEFIVLMLVFCRFDIIYNLATNISFLNRFTGHSITLADKLYQYTHFIHNCFTAPSANANNHYSWQLDAVTSTDFTGVIILILAIVSVILNHNKKSSLLAAGWIGFSVAVLLGLGWGTKENGLILYSLYFGWAFFVLLFQLVEKIESKLNVRFLLPVATICAAVVLLSANIPSISEMLKFAVTYYPA